MNKFLVFAVVLCACALVITAQDQPMDDMVPATPPQDQPQPEQLSQQQPEAQSRFWKKHFHYGTGYPASGYQYGSPSYGYGYQGYGYRPYGYGYRPYGYGYGR